MYYILPSLNCHGGLVGKGHYVDPLLRRNPSFEEEEPEQVITCNLIQIFYFSYIFRISYFSELLLLNLNVNFQSNLHVGEAFPDCPYVCL